MVPVAQAEQGGSQAWLSVSRYPVTLVQASASGLLSIMANVPSGCMVAVFVIRYTARGLCTPSGYAGAETANLPTIDADWKKLFYANAQWMRLHF